MTKADELRKTNKQDLLKKVLELKKKLSDIRFKFSANQMKNVKEISNTRKEIARMLTIVKESDSVKTAADKPK